MQPREVIWGGATNTPNASREGKRGEVCAGITAYAMMSQMHHYVPASTTYVRSARRRHTRRRKYHCCTNRSQEACGVCAGYEDTLYAIAVSPRWLLDAAMRLRCSAILRQRNAGMALLR